MDHSKISPMIRFEAFKRLKELVLFSRFEDLYFIYHEIQFGKCCRSFGIRLFSFYLAALFDHWIRLMKIDPIFSDLFTETGKSMYLLTV